VSRTSADDLCPANTAADRVRTTKMVANRRTNDSARPRLLAQAGQAQNRYSGLTSTLDRLATSRLLARSSGIIRWFDRPAERCRGSLTERDRGGKLNLRGGAAR